MGKGFKQLWGNKIYLIMPEKEESKVILAPELNKDLEKEFIAKFDKLEIYAVGDVVTKFKEGEKVLVDPTSLRRSPVIEVNKMKLLLISDHDIVHTW